MRADVSRIAEGVAGDITGAPQSPAARIRFQFEFAILMLSCGRTEEAQAAFRRGFELLEELDT